MAQGGGSVPLAQDLIDDGQHAIAGARVVVGADLTDALAIAGP
jgi:hypothetical protein